jgi:hypothetical protein
MLNKDMGQPDIDLPDLRDLLKDFSSNKMEPARSRTE